jgi:RNA polymerase sigma factor (sigma-70 family)
MIVAALIRARYQSKTAYQGIAAARMIVESPNRPSAMRVSFAQYRGASLGVTVSKDRWDTSSDEGFAGFYRDTYPWITQRVRAYFAGGDRDTVHDAVNEAYLRCRGRLEGLRSDDGNAQRKYVLEAALNNVRHQHRKRGVKHVWDPLADLDGQVADHATGVADKVTLLQGLARLPKRPRQVLILSVYADMNVEEIAKQLGISPRTVRTHLARALRAMHDYLRGRDS